MGGSSKRPIGPIGAALAFVAATVGLIVFVELVLDERFLIWLTNLPIVILHLGIIAFWCLFTLIVWWMAERTLDPDAREEHRETVQRLLLVVSSFFVFLLGFVVSQEWSNVNEVRSDISSAAAAIDTASYKAEALPEPQRQEVLVALQDLGRSIACQDIASIRNTGEGSGRTAAAIRDAFRALIQLPPSVQEESIFQDLLDEIGTVSVARGQMLAGASSGLPIVVMFAIFFVAGLLLILFVVQLGKGRRSHLLITVGLVLLVSVGTAMVLSLSRPFGGAATVEVDFAKASQQDYSDCSRPGS
jgi:hypothetical protein